MYKPAGLTNMMMKYNNTIGSDSKKLIPKCLVLLFLTIHFIWGFDFGFIKHLDKKTQKAAQIVTFLVNIIAIAMLSLPARYIIENPGVVWQLLYLLQYIIDLFILNCTKYNLYDFLIDISVINFRNSQKSTTINWFCAIMMTIYLFGIQLIKYVIYLCHYKNDISSIRSLLAVRYEIYGIWYYCIDFVPFAQIVIYYYIYISLRNIKDYVCEVNVNMNNIVEQYEDIADCYDKIMPLYDNIVSIESLFNRKFVTKFITSTRGYTR